MVKISYELCILAGNPGTPEKPFSEPGWNLFRKFWNDAILQSIQQKRESASLGIQEMAKVCDIYEP